VELDEQNRPVVRDAKTGFKGRFEAHLQSAERNGVNAHEQSFGLSEAQP
jgi:hypothetical protein